MLYDKKKQITLFILILSFIACQNGVEIQCLKEKIGEPFSKKELIDYCKSIEVENPLPFLYEEPYPVDTIDITVNLHKKFSNQDSMVAIITIDGAHKKHYIGKSVNQVKIKNISYYRNELTPLTFSVSLIDTVDNYKYEFREGKSSSNLCEKYDLYLLHEWNINEGYLDVQESRVCQK